MKYTCPKHGELQDEGPVKWWKGVALCPLCLEAGVNGKSDSFTVHKLQEA